VELSPTRNPAVLPDAHVPNALFCAPRLVSVAAVAAVLSRLPNHPTSRTAEPMAPKFAPAKKLAAELADRACGSFRVVFAGWARRSKELFAFPNVVVRGRLSPRSFK
jgi:hypothetical protein